jgi:hypothetical protein
LHDEAIGVVHVRKIKSRAGVAGLRQRRDVKCSAAKVREVTYIEEDSHAAAQGEGLDEDVVEYVVDNEARISVIDGAES